MGSIKGLRRGKYQTRSINGDVFCSRCNKRYKRRQSLLQHIRSKHLNIRSICTICLRKYTSVSTYNRHLRNVHGLTNKPDNNASTIEAPCVIEPLAKLNFEADSRFPSMANILSFKESKQFGKHVVANNDIKAGHIVMAAPAFACVEYLICTGSGCFYCGKMSKVKIQCPHCIVVWFCSEKCKNCKTHRIKCDSKFMRTDCHIIRLATQMITNAFNSVEDIETMIEFCRGVVYFKKKHYICQPPYSTYGEIVKLIGKAETRHAPMARQVVKHVMNHPKLISVNTNVKHIIYALAYHHINSIALNSFSEETKCSEGGASVRYSIFDALCRLNHSCDPNLNHFLDDDDITYCVTARPIKSGEQLFINYLGEMKFKGTEERRNYIKENWDFSCKCQNCI